MYNVLFEHWDTRCCLSREQGAITDPKDLKVPKGIPGLRDLLELGATREPLEKREQEEVLGKMDKMGREVCRANKEHRDRKERKEHVGIKEKLVTKESKGKPVTRDQLGCQVSQDHPVHPEHLVLRDRGDIKEHVVLLECEELLDQKDLTVALGKEEIKDLLDLLDQL